MRRKIKGNKTLVMMTTIFIATLFIGVTMTAAVAMHEIKESTRINIVTDVSECPSCDCGGCPGGAAILNGRCVCRCAPCIPEAQPEIGGVVNDGDDVSSAKDNSLDSGRSVCNNDKELEQSSASSIESKQSGDSDFGIVDVIEKIQSCPDYCTVMSNGICACPPALIQSTQANENNDVAGYEEGALSVGTGQIQMEEQMSVGQHVETDQMQISGVWEGIQLGQSEEMEEASSSVCQIGCYEVCYLDGGCGCYCPPIDEDEEDDSETSDEMEMDMDAGCGGIYCSLYCPYGAVPGSCGCECQSPSLEDLLEQSEQIQTTNDAGMAQQQEAAAQSSVSSNFGSMSL